MHKLCRQVSIESPGTIIRNSVFNSVVPIEDTPPNGARIKIVCAGACYRRNRSTSISSMSSVSSELSDYAPSGVSGSTPTTTSNTTQNTNSPAHHGIREGSLFPGFEVAGVIESLGEDVDENCKLEIGQRVVVFPFDDTPPGYAELINVPDLKYVVPIPDSLPISVAAMLPTGALLAMNAVFQAHSIVEKILKSRDDNNGKCKILIVGTGGLALWTVRIAAYHFANSECRNRIGITVACLRDEGFLLTKEMKNVNVVEWNESAYEPQLIERTKNACEGLVDVVIDFGITFRSLQRSMRFLSKGGVVLISEEVAEKLLPKFPRISSESQQEILRISLGTVDQLHQLVKLVADKEIEPPPHTVFPAEEAADVVQKLCNSEIPGRAILRFHDIE